jgi:oxygen-independent coproporphyrinogen-3 oxidase
LFEIDLAKLKKYDKPGPRYTSYPTAPHFNENFTCGDYLDEIIKTNYGEGLPDLLSTFTCRSVIRFVTFVVVT